MIHTPSKHFSTQRLKTIVENEGRVDYRQGPKDYDVEAAREILNERGVRLTLASVGPRPLERFDIVRLPSGKSGVISQVSETGAVSVFAKGEFLGIWYPGEQIKRIGRIKRSNQWS